MSALPPMPTTCAVDAAAEQQCSGTLDSHGRRYRCTRRAAKKHGYQLCGHCTALRVRRCGVAAANGETIAIYHRDDCAGCAIECCRDRSLCSPRCQGAPS